MANKNIGLYSIVVEDADSLTFIERMVADSRSIGLYHTSGLSTPQQVFMDFLALTHLPVTEKIRTLAWLMNWLTKDTSH